MAKMVLIKRVNINNDIYEHILDDVSKLENMNIFLSPLFKPGLNKHYNINKAVQYQKVIKSNNDEEDTVIIDDEEFNRRKEEEIRRKLLLYESCVAFILTEAAENKEVTLSQIRDKISEDAEKINELIPTVEIFREVVIELLKSKTINVRELTEEINSVVSYNKSSDFQLNETILNVIRERKKLSKIKCIHVNKCDSREKVVFHELKSERGIVKTVKCTDLKIKLEF